MNDDKEKIMNKPLLCRPKLTMMNEAYIKKIHDAATTILQKIGLMVRHAEMRTKLLDAGGSQGKNQHVYLSEEMVQDALKTAKRDVVIFNRIGEPVMPLGPHQIYFGTGSDLLYTHDIKTMERRLSCLGDVGQAARLCDALDEIDFVMSFTLPKEVDSEDVEPQQYYAMLENTIKPIIMTSVSGQATLERMHEMACLIAGGDKAFRKRPNYIMYGQFVSPLQHNLLAIERLVFCANHEIPLIYIPTIMPGASGPITLAGSIALAVAECLAGLVMHQVQKSGAPFIFGACVSQLDMRTMLFPYGSPEWRMNDLIMAELSRYYELPVFGTGGTTDSKIVDAQAGAEYASSLLMAGLAGTNLIHDVGYLESGLTGSLESILLGAEQIRYVKKILSGMEISDETLALDSIAEVGPANQFLDNDHTLKHLRQLIEEPYVADRDGYETWASAGSKDYAERARGYSRKLLESHQPQTIDDSMVAALRVLCNFLS